jgi:general secretion pathway protein D
MHHKKYGYCVVSRSMKWVCRTLRITGCFIWVVAVTALSMNEPVNNKKARLRHDGGKPVMLNFVNADLNSVIEIVSKITGRNFLLDAKVKVPINLVSIKPVQAKAVYALFLSALRQQDLVAIDLPGGVTKIVADTDSRSQPFPVLGLKQKVPVGKSHLYTYIQPLAYESPVAMIAALKPLMTANSSLSSTPNSNAIIVTDYAENIQRLQRIIKTLDVPAGEPVVLPLKYGSAGEMASTLNRVLSEMPVSTPGGAGSTEGIGRVNVLADTRTNSILLKTDTLARKVQLEQWIEKLDLPSQTPDANLHIVYLKNAEASKISNLLRNIYGISVSQIGNDLTGSSPANPSQTASASMAASSSSAELAASRANGLTNQSFASSSSGVSVYADTANNALIVLAPETLYNGIKKIIDQMDIRRAQVFVEALVVEMSADQAAEFGIQWQNFGGLNKTSVSAIGGTNFGGVGTNILGVTPLGPNTLSSLGQGLNIGIIKGTLTLPGIGQITNLGLLARALETNTQANILSVPTLMTLDNEEARIVVGQNVPFITGQYTQSAAGNTTTPFQTIERRDVGLTLKVKPQVTEGGVVKLTLFQEVSSVVDQSNAAGVITNKRSIESTVLIDNEQILVLGGLIQDSRTNEVSKVPLAGDVPVLGSLFRYNNQKQAKTNLMLFMKPTIIRSALASEAVSTDRYRYLIDEIKHPTPLDHHAVPSSLLRSFDPESLLSSSSTRMR